MKKATKKVVKAATTPAPGGNTWNIQDKALKELERGLAQLHKQNYEEALPHFQAILDGYAQEKELVDRVQVYPRVCNSKIDARTPPHRKPEEFYYPGVSRPSKATSPQTGPTLDP